MSEEREDVEATPQQDIAPDTSQQKEKSRAIGGIVGVTFGFVLLLIIGWGFAQVIGWNPDISSEHFAQFYFAWGLGILSLGYLVLILWSIFKKDEDPRWFHARILSSGIVGGSYAFLLPVVMSLPEGNVNSGGAAALRQAILLATGGLIALIALGETRRKNDNDREAAENLRAHQENMLIQQKKQFEANAFKERKAERRERYTKAVEQLGDEKSPIRMGGVYTLVGLVDEWLEEESIRKYEDRLKEGQVIINNLCAYIRSPFPLYARYDILFKGSPNQIAQYFSGPAGFYDDKSKLESEIDIRLNIIKEIHEHLQGEEGNLWGAWSNFEYNFSGSVFFYPVNLTNSYYKKPVTFTGSTYQDMANFSGSTYQDEANFRGSTYQGQANFSGSTYQRAYFTGSTYQRAYFTGSTYQSWADFSGSTYQRAYFTGSTYKSWANFRNSTYKDVADFSGSIFYSDIYFGKDGDINSFSRFTDYTPQFYDGIHHKKTLFGSHNNNFTVDTNKGNPIILDSESLLPLDCDFLTPEQQDCLARKFQDMEKINNKLREVKDLKEKAELSEKLRDLNNELHKWREEATTVKVEDVAAEDTES